MGTSTKSSPFLAMKIVLPTLLQRFFLQTWVFSSNACIDHIQPKTQVNSSVDLRCLFPWSSFLYTPPFILAAFAFEFPTLSLQFSKTAEMSLDSPSLPGTLEMLSSARFLTSILHISFLRILLNTTQSMHYLLIIHVKRLLVYFLKVITYKTFYIYFRPK